MKKIYCLHDKPLDLYESLSLCINDADVVRQVQSAIQRDPKIILNEHAEDFEIVCLGDFDDNTGEIIPGKRIVIQIYILKKE